MSQLTLRRTLSLKVSLKESPKSRNLKRLLSGNRVWLTGTSAGVTLASQDGKGRVTHKLGCSISWV